MAWNYLVGNGKELHFIGPFIKKDVDLIVLDEPTAIWIRKYQKT